MIRAGFCCIKRVTPLAVVSMRSCESVYYKHFGKKFCPLNTRYNGTVGRMYVTV